MKSIKLHILLIGVIINLNGYAQSDVKIRFSTTKIDTQTEMIIPIGNEKYLYEKYSNFKYRYWLLQRDTLAQKNDSLYVGSTVKININKDFFSKSACDSLVNLMRNDILFRESVQIIQDIAKRYIGDRNKELFNGRTDFYDDRHVLCYEDFQKLCTKLIDEKIIRIKIILEKKEKRYEQIVNSTSLSHEFISEFLNDFDKCEPDYHAVIELISKNANGFLSVCEQLPEDDFLRLTWKLSALRKTINTDKAVQSLKNTKYKMPRKNKLIRKLS